MGSTIRKRTSSGVDLYRRLTISELMHTDLPEPVEPAISRCGILAKSVTATAPAISRPRTTVSLLFADTKEFDSTRSRMRTTLIFLFGTSMPTAALPGMGASMRTPAAARFMAMSSLRLVILLIFTPGAGCSSYRVTAGPRLMSTIFVCTPKLFSVPTSILPLLCSSAVISSWLTPAEYSSMESGGKWYPSGCCTGSAARAAVSRTALCSMAAFCTKAAAAAAEPEGSCAAEAVGTADAAGTGTGATLGTGTDTGTETCTACGFSSGFSCGAPPVK